MDLFEQRDEEPLPLPDADVRLLRRPVLPLPAAQVMARLLEETPWATREIRLFGKTLPEPRESAWYGDPGTEYRYSGLLLHPLPWTPLLQQLREAVERASGSRFNSVLLNHYRNEQDSMGMHADDEPELGQRPVIASLSLGAERVLTFRHRYDRALKPLRVPLADGSLLLMAGDTQRYWKHGIAKLSRPCGPRLNLTFRQIRT
ncbi:alpha-ketoglutarate-dependent dioxygenase AlkB [Parahaliea maris]|uniref:Alpha-ketoglutarate-dependent dioxygenase AlkB n=2 Tax=Parahaliea maris TaxID=2716870 RepID=A0A5C8ZSP8_9GAMM|nr:alpha-ketoglutarate-dependent dioxygenase AlkB [Parahaliea maris]